MFSSDVAMDAVRREYEKLVESVEAARNAYYVNDAPVMSDADYDALYRRLEEFEAAYPALTSRRTVTHQCWVRLLVMLEVKLLRLLRR